MKRFFISFVLIISLLFNVFADNKQAHKELREEFEKTIFIDKILENDPNFYENLDKIDNAKELSDYLWSIFKDKDGMPIDMHTAIYMTGNNYKTYFSAFYHRTLGIEWFDEYGSKDELLKKGYKEDEIFYYPYFNGEWKDGYRVGKKFMGFHRSYSYGRPDDYFMESKKALLVGLHDFQHTDHSEVFNAIKNSKKKNLILDLSYNQGGWGAIYHELIDNIKIMKPKKIFILASNATVSYGDRATFLIEKDTGINTTVVGMPTQGLWRGGKREKIIQFDDFKLEAYIVNVVDEGSEYYDQFPPEGIGAMPDIYAYDTVDALEIAKHLIGDNELSLPASYATLLKSENGNKVSRSIKLNK